MALTRLAHQLVRDHFANQTKGVAVDGTCGNGHDTEFLAKSGFSEIVGFDVQQQAIDATHDRLKDIDSSKISLLLLGHQHLGEVIESGIDCAMYNFGYLPKADKSITTQSHTSVTALAATLERLNENGLICLICYPGHSEGKVETMAIKRWLEGVKQPWRVTQYLSGSPKPEAPILYTIHQQPEV